MAATELHSPLMDDSESTRVADVAQQDSTAPTIAADVANSETQSIYAWSQSDDDETVAFQRRSWKVPIAVTMLMAAAAAGIGIYAWPEHKSAPNTPVAAAPAPSVAQPAPPPPPKPESNDEKFIRLMREQHLLRVDSPGPDEMMAQSAVQACRRLDAGEPVPDLIENVRIGTPIWSLSQAEAFVSTAMNVYCPQHAG